MCFSNASPIGRSPEAILRLTQGMCRVPPCSRGDAAASLSIDCPGCVVPVASAVSSFEDDFKTLQARAVAPATTTEDLVRNLRRLYREVYERDLGRYSGPELRAAAPSLMTGIFRLRTSLRDRIPEWHAKGLMTREAQKALRDCLRILRYASDMLGELNSGHQVAGEGDVPIRAFRESSYNTFVHPAFDTGRDLAFRSGDILLVRGMHHNSAAIARIGDINSQFSHASIVHVDEAGKMWVVESLIELGAVVSPLKDALQHGIARAMLFRHKDAALAADASRRIYNHVRRSHESYGRRILYDFSMRLHSYNELFCSKLIRLAYEDASHGRLKLPTFTTLLDAKNRDFFKRVGVKANETFAPGDLEIEPHLDLVAEWQDYRFTPRLRLQDMIMTKLFEWMDLYGYRFREDYTVRLIGVFGRLSSYLSKGVKDMISSVVPKVPPNMSRRTIATIAMLHKTAQPILENLQHEDRVRVTAEGHTLHPREVFDRLEELRNRSGNIIGYLVAPKKWKR